FDLISAADGISLANTSLVVEGLAPGWQYSTSEANGEFALTALNNGVSSGSSGGTGGGGGGTGGGGGGTGGGGSGASVPEPSTLALLAAGALGLAVASRSSRRRRLRAA
ncbi:MAG TPA: PEP-CTERM sorting domain-containing protein, partial [Steroidobacteraceae bacterium]|nr:PEP-CTERM sorting domain-containing protein [Steroidobacteraceae bacterium]